MPTSVLKLDGCAGSFEVSKRAYASSIPMVGREQGIHHTALSDLQRVPPLWVLFPQATDDFDACRGIVVVSPFHRRFLPSRDIK